MLPRLRSSRRRFLEMGYDSIIKNENPQKFLKQLNAKELHAKRSGNIQEMDFFKIQKKLFK